MKKITLFFLLLFFNFNLTVNNVSAGVWSNVASDIAIEVSRELRIQIRMVINAQAKMAAIKQVQNTIQSSLANGSSSPKYITNYKDFLIAQPHAQAQAATENFLTKTLRGKTSGNYVSVDSSVDADGVNISYTQYLSNIGQVVVEGNMKAETDITEICDPLKGLFVQGNWDCFEIMMNNPLNTPIGLAIATEDYLTQKTGEYQLEAQGKLQTSDGGFLPVVDENGNVTLPAGIVSELQSKGVTLPLEAIANSDSEAFSVLVESFAMRAISDVVNYGLGEVSKKFNNSAIQFSSEFDLEYDAARKEYGPKVRFDVNAAYQ